MRFTIHRTAVLIAACLAPALAAAADLHQELGDAFAAPPSTYEAARAELVDGLDAGSLDAATTSDDWRVRMTAAAVAVWQGAPEQAAAAWGTQPVVTRADFYRFTDASLTEPGATAVLVERLAHADEHHEVRAALVEVIGRSLADDASVWSGPLAGMYATERAADVRAGIAFVMRRAPGADALPVLSAAMRDADPAVRAEAVRSVAWRDDGDQLGAALITALSDVDAEVRAEAARAIGWRGVTAGADALRPLLSDGAGDVRLHALRSLDRLGALDKAGSLSAFLADPDPRVARLAARLSN